MTASYKFEIPQMGSIHSADDVPCKAPCMDPPTVVQCESLEGSSGAAGPRSWVPDVVSQYDVNIDGEGGAAKVWGRISNPEIKILVEGKERV
jgi:hypothetical protein